MNVKIVQETPWKRALNAARRTVGKDPLDKDPSDSWKDSILYAEHSPIRLVEYRISFEDIRQWVTTHLVRHWLGFIPFIHSHLQFTSFGQPYSCSLNVLLPARFLMVEQKLPSC